MVTDMAIPSYSNIQRKEHEKLEQFQKVKEKLENAEG